MEIGLFWQRSNYFLVLSTAIAVGVFSLRDIKYAVPLAAFGLLVALLWIAVNLGGKFWQSRWEYRAGLTEKRLRPDMNLHSASWQTVQDDVRRSFEFRQRGPVHRAYQRLVLLKPSVSLVMTILSLAFFGFWIVMLIMTLGGVADATVAGSRGLTIFLVRHEHEPYLLWPSALAWISAAVAAGWAVWLYVSRREGKPVVEIDLASQALPYEEGRFLAYFDVTLTNKSKRRVLARKRAPDRPAFSDRGETVQHSCSLLLRRLAANAPTTTQVGWFSNPGAKSPLPADIVANLLEGYEYEIEGKEDFYVEPAEASHLSVGVVLEPGIYLALVTVVGQPADDSEFWRREFLVQIPKQGPLTQRAEIGG